MSRAYTAEEVRKQVLDHLKTLANYWASLPDKTDLEKCEGLIFSTLVMLDGHSTALPAFDLVLKPHPDDKEFCISEGENYYENGQVINDCVFHDEFYK